MLATLRVRQLAGAGAKLFAGYVLKGAASGPARRTANCASVLKRLSVGAGLKPARTKQSAPAPAYRLHL